MIALKRMVIHFVFLSIGMLFTFVAVSLWYYFSFEQYVVDGHSMTPTLHQGDVVRASSDFSVLGQGDIAVFSFAASDVQHVKRVVAVPGDHIVFTEEGRIVLNGDFADRDHLKDPAIEFTHNNLYAVLKQLEFYNYVIPDGMYLMMGDNRGDSVDSNLYGLIPFDQIHLQVYDGFLDYLF